MVTVLAAARGRGRLLRYLVLCLVLLFSLQCFLSLLSSRHAVSTSFFHFDRFSGARSASESDDGGGATPRLLLTVVANSSGALSPLSAVTNDPLLSRVMQDKSTPKSRSPPPKHLGNNTSSNELNVSNLNRNESAGSVLATHSLSSNSANSSDSGPAPAVEDNSAINGPAEAGSTPRHNAHAIAELCPPVPVRLVGPLKAVLSAPSWEEMETMEGLRDLQPGGRYQPPDCVARHRVAIIIPYRDREEHLRIFLHHLHPILQRQQLDYGVYVIEQAGAGEFNRAMLMNVGAKESLLQHDYQCFIFHDVDLLPEDDRNLYTCPQQPRHMSVAVDTMHYKLPYAELFGGVSAITRQQFELVNGFSNEYWGWGGEDDDMYNRLTFHHLHIARYPANVARYKMLKHQHGKVNPKRFDLLRKGKKRFSSDGLSSLNYERKDLVLKKLYTWLLIEIRKR